MYGKAVTAMKFRTFQFHLEQGVRGLLKNGIMSLASIGIVGACIFIVIISLCVAFNIDSILQQIENNIGIEIFFGNEPTEEQIAGLEEQIKQQPHVVSVTYNSYDDALDKAKEKLNMESLESLRDDNPLPRSFYISLDSIKAQKSFIEYLNNLQMSFEAQFLAEKQAADVENAKEAATEQTTAAPAAETAAEPASVSADLSVEQAAEQVQEITTQDINAGLNIGDHGYTFRGIEKIMHAQGATSTLSAIDTVVRVVSLILVILLCIVSVGIIMNTIKLTVFIRKNEISIMKYVGATDWFIRWPFVIEGLLIGLIGAAIPCIISVCSYDKMVEVIYDKAPIIKKLFTFVEGGDMFAMIVPVSLLIGALLGVIGSANAIRKHLNV